MAQKVDPRTILAGVLAVLAGVPAAEVGAQMSIKIPELEAATELYQAAGYTALERQATQQAGTRSTSSSTTGTQPSRWQSNTSVRN